MGKRNYYFRDQASKVIRWRGSPIYFDRKLNHNYYSGCFLGDNLTVAVGDYVLISHSDIVDGDTSEAYIARISQMYDSDNPESPFRAEVIWFMRNWELPPKIRPKNADEREVFLCMANYETSIDLETVIQKCEVKLLEETDTPKVNNHSGRQCFYSRYAFNGKKLLPLDVSDSSVVPVEVHALQDLVNNNNTPKSTSKSVASANKKSARKTPARGTPGRGTPKSCGKENLENGTPRSVPRARKSLGFKEELSKVNSPRKTFRSNRDILDAIENGCDDDDSLSIASSESTATSISKAESDGEESRSNRRPGGSTANTPIQKKRSKLTRSQSCRTPSSKPSTPRARKSQLTTFNLCQSSDGGVQVSEENTELFSQIKPLRRRSTASRKKVVESDNDDDSDKDPDFSTKDKDSSDDEDFVVEEKISGTPSRKKKKVPTATLR